MLNIEPGPVTRITLDRPDRHNAFDEALIAALTAAFRQAGSDAGVRAVVLAGAGKSFCAGADIDWMRRAGSWTAAENSSDAMKLSDMLLAIDSCPKPVIAVVHGTVAGGGVGLVACADMAVAIEGASFRLSEVRLGLTPATISPFVVARIGAAARRWFLTAEAFGAAEARAMGLVAAVAADTAAAAAVVDGWLAALHAGPPGAIADAKALIAAVANRSVDDALRHDTAARIAARRTSAEGQEGLAAFLDKRKPAWASGG